MARLNKRSVLTGASGRIGNLVTYVLNGVQVVRTLPHRDKKIKPTQQQETHRYAFKEMHRFARSVKTTIIDRIWTHLPVNGGMNAYNLFIKTNRTVFGLDETIVFPDLLSISKGDLYPAENFEIEREDSMLHLKWTNNSGGKYAKKDDRLNVAILLHRNELKVFENLAKREEEGLRISVDLPDYSEGYAFWSSGDDSSFSPSIYWRLQASK